MGARIPAVSTPHGFMTTRWSLVMATRGGSDASRRALDELCATYWFPLYVHARRSGLGEADAQDLVQGLLADLLERGGGLDGADQGKGRFRTYLLGALRHHGTSEARAGRALKRGGGSVVSLEAARADGSVATRYQGMSLDDLSPDEAFDRAWALELIRSCKDQLRAEYEARGRLAVYEALEDILDGGSGARTYAERAEELDCSLGALKVTAHRLRRRMGELIRAEVAGTVSDPMDVEAELSLLIEALGASS